MTLVLMKRHNVLLPIATVGSYELFKYCFCLHRHMPLALDKDQLHQRKPTYHAYPSISLHTVEGSGICMQFSLS